MHTKRKKNCLESGTYVVTQSAMFSHTQAPPTLINFNHKKLTGKRKKKLPICPRLEPGISGTQSKVLTTRLLYTCVHMVSDHHNNDTFLSISPD